MSNTTTDTVTPSRWPRLTAGVVIVVALAYAGFSAAQQWSDGPLNDMIPGGSLRSGTLITEPIQDWSFVHGQTVELELIGYQTSRFTGLMEHKGKVYVPCDLGYMWGRFDGNTRRALHLIYIFKHWHTDALNDGRMAFRLDAKRYEGMARLVTDSATVAELKTSLESLARQWLAPEQLGPAPTQEPNDIWFFELTL
ncbi:MAG: hypothetical protein NXH85_12140 [Pseudomonadaceae bacterium]|nr:hypothetical protein [Pseudomonadaceae bacterium]